MKSKETRIKTVKIDKKEEKILQNITIKTILLSIEKNDILVDKKREKNNFKRKK